MSTAKYFILLAFVILSLFIYGKFFFDIEDYKTDITNYISEKINYDFTYDGQLLLELEPNATITITKIIIRDTETKKNISKIEKLILRINKEKMLSNIIDVESVEISNMIMFGINTDEILMKTYKIIKDQKYLNYSDDNFTTIKYMKANAVIENNLMTINDIKISTSLLLIQGEGSINVKTKDIDFSMIGVLNNRDQVSPAYINDYPDELKGNKLPIKLKNNISNIDFSVDLTDIIKKQIIDPIKDKILDKLEEKVREKIRIPF